MVSSDMSYILIDDLQISSNELWYVLAHLVHILYCVQKLAPWHPLPDLTNLFNYRNDQIC